MNKSKISPELVQKIKDGVNIVDVVSERVVLKKSGGANHMGLCPLHQERSPSFSVNEQKQLFYCYGCQRGGDIIKFLTELDGITFPEALEELAERAGIKLPRDYGGGDGSPEEEKRRAAAREKLELCHKLNRFAAVYYQKTLVQDPEAGKYLRTRGVSTEEIRGFYLGSAPAAWDGLARHLVSAKAPLDTAVELGLIRPSPKNAPSGGVGYFDLFRARAIFPLVDLRGKIIGFGGRTLPGVDSDGPKYLNSKESPIYHKGRFAYGMRQAQREAREKDEIILVEGYFDVVALHAAGFRNVVALCGTGLTVDHLALFRRFASKITLLLDGDKAGIAATERAMELGLSQGLVLHGAAMPEGLDPDEVLFDQETGTTIPEGKERMASILEHAKPILDERIAGQIREASKGPEARTQAIKQIGHWLASFQDPVGREVRMQDVQSKLGIPRPLLEQAARGASQPASRARPVAPNPGFSGQIPARTARVSGPQTGPNRASTSDRILLRALAWGGSGLEKFREARQKLPPELTLADLFDYFPARAFLARFLEDGGLSPTFALSQDAVQDPETDAQVRSILTEAWVSGSSRAPSPDAVSDPDSPSELEVALNRSIKRLWAQFSQRIKAALQDAEAKKDAGLCEQLSQQYLDVQRKMKEFSGT